MDGQLAYRLGQVSVRLRPFFLSFNGSQVHEFHQRLIIREDATIVAHLPNLPEIPFDDIRCVDDFSKGRGVLEIGITQRNVFMTPC